MGAFGTATAVTFGRPWGGVDMGRGAALARVARAGAAALATFLADFTGVAEGRAVRARAERRDMRLGLGV